MRPDSEGDASRTQVLLPGHPGHQSSELSGPFAQVMALSGQPDTAFPTNQLVSVASKRSEKLAAGRARGFAVSEASPRGTYPAISEALRTRIAEGAFAEGLPSEADPEWWPACRPTSRPRTTGLRRRIGRSPT